MSEMRRIRRRNGWHRQSPAVYKARRLADEVCCWNLQLSKCLFHSLSSHLGLSLARWRLCRDAAKSMFSTRELMLQTVDEIFTDAVKRFAWSAHVCYAARLWYRACGGTDLQPYAPATGGRIQRKRYIPRDEWDIRVLTSMQRSGEVPRYRAQKWVSTWKTSTGMWLALALEFEGLRFQTWSRSSKVSDDFLTTNWKIFAENSQKTLTYTEKKRRMPNSYLIIIRWPFYGLSNGISRCRVIVKITRERIWYVYDCWSTPVELNIYI